MILLSGARHGDFTDLDDKAEEAELEERMIEDRSSSSLSSLLSSVLALSSSRFVLHRWPEQVATTVPELWTMVEPIGSREISQAALILNNKTYHHEL